ncbi:hypothetical protein AAHV87_25995 [Klebsiella variicola subsp. variicola]|uniref:hypothetical protein n=1 Tax=Klebsiella variicola TaxID=244366 RepID=UPI0035A244CC|nr:hypothetical protein [Klebsiella variicola subsp. variicola]
MTFIYRLHIASVVVLMGDTSCKPGIARGLEAQYAEFGDDFMEQFHDDFLTQVQFDNALLCDIHHKNRVYASSFN